MKSGGIIQMRRPCFDSKTCEEPCISAVDETPLRNIGLTNSGADCRETMKFNARSTTPITVTTWRRPQPSRRPRRSSLAIAHRPTPSLVSMLFSITQITRARLRVADLRPGNGHLAAPP